MNRLSCEGTFPKQVCHWITQSTEYAEAYTHPTDVFVHNACSPCTSMDVWATTAATCTMCYLRPSCAKRLLIQTSRSNPCKAAASAGRKVAPQCAYASKCASNTNSHPINTVFPGLCRSYQAEQTCQCCCPSKDNRGPYRDGLRSRNKPHAARCKRMLSRSKV